MSRYRKLLDPAGDDWPVFPTFHLPTLYETLCVGLRENHGWSETKVEEYVGDLTGQMDVFEALREYELTPPSINTDGAWRIMRRLCEDAGIGLDDKHGYLAPHGRHGAGEVMVCRRGFTAAVRLLDNGDEVVRESCSHIEAKGMAKDAGDAFAEHDR